MERQAFRVAGDTVYVEGRSSPARQDPAFPYYGSDIQRQARDVLEGLRAVLRSAGCDLKDVVKTQVFLLDLNDFFYFDQVWKAFFPAPPPRTTVQVSGLPVPGSKVQVDAWAVRPSVARQVISGKSTPTPMAHYSQGILAGETLYAAGQIASDYKTGVPPEARQDPAFPYYGSNIQRQARYVLGNLKSVFEAAGCGFEDVVKSQVFLTDVNDFYYFDQVWKEFFPSPPPRTTVQVSGLLVPGCKVEIDLWGVKPGVKKTLLTGKDTPTPMAHYCQGILAGKTVYAAGQIASDYKTGVPPEARQDQARYVLKNLRSVLQAAGADFADVVKAQIFITDPRDLEAIDRAWKELFPAAPPRTVVQIGALLVPGCRIEIDLTAVLPL